MKTRVIVPVAGKGKRFDADIPKQFFHLAGTPVIVHTVSKFIASPLIIGGVIVFSEEDIVKYSHILKNVDGFSDKFEIISGGEHRQDSVYNGIQALPNDTEIVLVHDGVRPFVDDGLISRCIQGVKENDACIAAIPANDPNPFD
jgi:2-C-methyl-D-erythritol 4-phosphate cytidylyltransferase